MNKKTSFLLGAGPSHLFYHASAVALIITVIMVALWMVLLCIQTMPTHDFSQLPSFLISLMSPISTIAIMVFIISFCSAMFGLWLKCGLNHSYFYRINGTDTNTRDALMKYLGELNFISQKPNFLLRNNLLINLNIDHGSWSLILRPRAWSPNLKVNQELREVAWHIQKFIEGL